MQSASYRLHRPDERYLVRRGALQLSAEPGNQGFPLVSLGCSGSLVVISGVRASVRPFAQDPGETRRSAVRGGARAPARNSTFVAPARNTTSLSTLSQIPGIPARGIEREVLRERLQHVRVQVGLLE